jgi:glycosyltransferase involved in cell wall biosynthesis
LYASLRERGYEHRYAGELTPSHTLNVLALPLELIWLRLRGWGVLHLHWVFFFQLAWADRRPWARRLAQAWFSLTLAVARRAGLRIVWTAHNVLPHDPVFADDRAARRELVRRADLVLAHSDATLAALAELGARPRRAAVIPLGSYMAPATVIAAPVRPAGDPLRLLFFGRIAEYKGVEDLVAAVRALPPEVGVEAVIVGACGDEELRARLAAAAGAEPRIDLRIGFVPDEELTELVAASHLVVLPFRAVTTSSSVALALEHGRGAVIPHLPAFADLPAAAVLRYDGSVSDLVRVLLEASRWDASAFIALGASAAQFVSPMGWDETGARVDDALRALDAP